MELRHKLAEIVEALGYELVGMERTQQVLRIYIDKEQGITVDDCSRVSHQVSAMLDVEDPIAERYSLEVSSPGINRPLFTPEQYQRHLTHKVKLHLRQLVQNRRKIEGTLLTADSMAATILLENGEKMVLPFSVIERANIIADIDIKKKRAKK